MDELITISREIVSEQQDDDSWVIVVTDKMSNGDNRTSKMLLDKNTDVAAVIVALVVEHR